MRFNFKYLNYYYQIGLNFYKTWFFQTRDYEPFAIGCAIIIFLKGGMVLSCCTTLSILLTNQLTQATCSANIRNTFYHSLVQIMLIGCLSMSLQVLYFYHSSISWCMTLGSILSYWKIDTLISWVKHHIIFLVKGRYY